MTPKLNTIASAVFTPICLMAAIAATSYAQDTSTPSTTSPAPSAAASPSDTQLATPIPYIAPKGAPEPNDISSATSADSETSVFIGGTSIMRVRYASGGYTPAERAHAIQARVNRLLGQGPITPDDVTIQDMGDTDSAVYVKGQLLFTADEMTARYNDTTPHNLAAKWASTMRRVLPSLTRPA
jgi:hypothetical protein